MTPEQREDFRDRILTLLQDPEIIRVIKESLKGDPDVIREIRKNMSN